MDLTADPDSTAKSSESCGGRDVPLGLIGIGLMGSAIAERLLRSGWRVLGWDIDANRRVTLRGLGGMPAKGTDEIVGSCKRIVLSLPTEESVAGVIRSVEERLQAGQLIVDTSTGSPGAAVEQAERLARRGGAYLDATVSGSSQQLRDGEAVLMVGATAPAFDACRDLFACLAVRAFHTGAPGSGSRMKLITNLVLGLNRAALAEGLAFAEAIGVEPARALEVLAGSMAYSRVMDGKGRKMVEQDFTPEARLSQHLKDVRLMLHAAVEAGLELPLSEAHRRMLERAESAGWGDLDNSAVIQAVRGARP